MFIEGTYINDCPFCGCEPHVTRILEHYVADGEYPAGEFEVGWCISCVTCGISMHDEYREEVAKFWNTRKNK